MTQLRSRSEFSASIEHSSNGWSWEVRHNGNLYAEEILPELSRMTAESMCLKYLSELLGGENDSSNN